MESLLQLFASALIGGVIEAIAGRQLDSRLDERRRRLEAQVAEQDATAFGEDLRSALGAAAEEVALAYGGDEGRRLEALLGRPRFAEELARRLLLESGPGGDLGALEAAFRGEHAKGGEAAEAEWTELELPLSDFLEAFRTHLEGSDAGPLLRQVRQLASLARIEHSNEAVVSTLLEVRQLIARSADGADERTDLLARVVVSSEGGEAKLGELVGLIKALLVQLGSSPAAASCAAATSSGPTPAEKAYLRDLRARCQDIPLADHRDDRRPRLSEVYVGLATTSKPSDELLFRRWGVEAKEKQERLAAELREWMASHGREDAQAEGALPETERESLLAFARAVARHAARESGERETGDHPLSGVGSHEELAATLGPLTALEAFSDHPHVVFLGHPGSGKTTFVNILAGTFAGALLGELDDSERHLAGRFATPLIPYKVVLLDWARELEGNESPHYKLVYRELRRLVPGLPDDAAMPEWLGDEHVPRLVLFDGLDEVPANEAGSSPTDLLRVIVGSVAAFCRAHPTLRVLISCRKRPWGRGGCELPGMPAFELAKLDPGRVRRFVRRWYDEVAHVGQLSGSLAQQRRDRLLAGLESGTRLAELAETPLLLTMLAKVNQEKELPESRADLYRECVDQLLWKWEGAKHGRRETGREDGDGATLLDLMAEAGADRLPFEKVLWKSTFESHGRKGGREVDDLRREDLQPELELLYRRGTEGAARWAGRVLDLMAHRSGLLVVSETGVFNYPHRSFQEYMAARWLSSRTAAPELARGKADDPGWSEVIRLACGALASQGNDGIAAAIALEVCGPPEEREEGSAFRALLAGEAWRDCRAGWPEEPEAETETGTGEALRVALDARLTRLAQSGDAAPKDRLKAGLLLADLEILPGDLEELVAIDGGAERGSFQIGRYPVTNHQYRRFVEAGGYQRDREWWDEEAEREILEAPEWAGGGSWPVGPRYRDNPRFARATLPVVGISWYEARAYCAWLTGVWREEGRISHEEEVRLPTEAQWARVAAGAEGRKFPWNGPFDAACLNSAESGLNGPTPVHTYPAGATPEGVFDLAGNVWEWTADNYRDVEGAKILAGGAWYRNSENTGSAARGGHHPGGRSGSLGFRVCVVPSSRANPES